MSTQDPQQLLDEITQAVLGACATAGRTEFELERLRANRLADPDMVGDAAKAFREAEAELNKQVRRCIDWYKNAFERKEERWPTGL